MTDSTVHGMDERTIDRRSLLRKGRAAAVAGIAGIAVVELASADPAGAASGDSFTLGTSNDSGTDGTTLTADVDSAAALEIGNSGEGAALRLTETEFPDDTDAVFTSGDLSNYSGSLFFATPYDDAGDSFPAMVYSEANANLVVPIVPQRVLDTRSAAGRAKIMNPSGNLNSAGQILAGKTVQIRLDDYAIFPTAVYCNITAVTPPAPGFAQVFAGGTRPVSSSVNFGAKQSVANFAITGVSTDDDLVSTVSIYCASTTHIILDITAFSVINIDLVEPSILPDGSDAATRAKALAAGVKAGKTPSWYRPTR